MNEPTTTIVGNATADCELRFAPSGIAVAHFTVAQTPRIKRGDDWVDGNTIFMPVTVFKAAAENCAESVKRGTRVIVTGKLQMEKWEKDGVERERMGMIADEVGLSTQFATVTAQRAERTAGPPAGGDPWAATPGAPAAPWGGAPAGPAPAWGAPAPQPPAYPQPPTQPAGPPAGYPQPPAPGGYSEPPF